MEYQKIANLLDETTDKPKRFQTRRWIEIIDDRRRNDYEVGGQIRYKTTPLMSSLCDYSEAYIVVKGTATVTATDANAAQRVQKTKQTTKCRHQVFKNTNH